MKLTYNTQVVNGDDLTGRTIGPFVRKGEDNLLGRWFHHCSPRKGYAW